VRHVYPSGRAHRPPTAVTAFLSLLDLLELERLDRNLYRAPNPPGSNRPALYGGQVAAQALRAALLTVPEDRHVHSLHGYFLRRGRVDLPVILKVDEDRDGGAFSARRVVAIQDGEVIFNLSASFHVDEPGGEVQDPMPADVPGPEDAPTWAETRRDVDGPARYVDLRPVVLGAASGPGGHRPAGQLWARCPVPLPDDRAIHACVLAYVSDIGTGFAKLDMPGLPPGGPSLDHAVWFHKPIRMDGWVLLDMHPLAASGGRGLYIGALYDRDGVRGASLTQECLLRPPRPARAAPP